MSACKLVICHTWITVKMPRIETGRLSTLLKYALPVSVVSAASFPFIEWIRAEEQIINKAVNNTEYGH